MISTMYFVLFKKKGKTQKQKQQNRAGPRACMYTVIIELYVFCSNFNKSNILPQLQ